MKGVGRSWLGANLIAVLVLAVAISGCANQAPRYYGACGVGGAAIGLLAGAGAGVGIAYNNKSHPTGDNAGAAAGLGAGIGAVIGLVAGHELCDPLVPPPPPAPLPMATPMPMAAQVTAPPAAPPEKTRIVLRGVHFDFNKFNIRPDDEPVLDEAVESLKEHPDVTVNVNGYCDAVGGVEYNLRLSRTGSGCGPIPVRARRSGLAPGRSWLWQDQLRRLERHRRGTRPEPARRTGTQ